MKNILLILIFVAGFTIEVCAQPTYDFGNSKPRHKKNTEQNSSGGSIPIWTGIYGFGGYESRGQNSYLTESQLMKASKSAGKSNSLPIYVNTWKNSSTKDFTMGSGSTNCPNIDLLNGVPDSSNYSPAYVPAPGALLLGCGGMLIVSWLRRRLR